MIKLVSAVAFLLLAEVAMPLSTTMNVNTRCARTGLDERILIRNSASDIAILVKKTPVNLPVQTPKEVAPVKPKRLCRVAVK